MTPEQIEQIAEFGLIYADYHEFFSLGTSHLLGSVMVALVTTLQETETTDVALERAVEIINKKWILEYGHCVAEYHKTLREQAGDCNCQICCDRYWRNRRSGSRLVLTDAEWDKHAADMGSSESPDGTGGAK